ncbi:hypothetical protein VZT92_022635 [Zoarces viviparus]|uniref:Uncharacterized protein n=1 Tax=Zoarces viviparus TaxID=48416 RepID=A0AAW1EBI7_ZOAVI
MRELRGPRRRRADPSCRRGDHGSTGLVPRCPVAPCERPYCSKRLREGEEKQSSVLSLCDSLTWPEGERLPQI